MENPTTIYDVRDDSHVHPSDRVVHGSAPRRDEFTSYSTHSHSNWCHDWCLRPVARIGEQVMIQALLGPIAGLATSWIEAKTTKQTAEAKLKLTEAEAKANRRKQPNYNRRKV